MEILYVVRLLGFLVAFLIVRKALILFHGIKIARGDFLFRLVIALGLLIISVYPQSVKILSSLMSMEGRDFGRIISLVVPSIFFLFLLIFSERSRSYVLKKELDLLIRKLVLPVEAVNGLKDWFNSREVLVIMPALNEGESLEELLPQMPKEINSMGVGILIIDDGSSDNTVEVAESYGCAVLSNPFRRGQGAASRVGYDVADLLSAKIAVTMDSDGQHLPDDIKGIIAPIAEGHADMVMGSRLLGHREKDSLFRLAGIYLFSNMVTFLAGTRITDCSSGFKAFKVNRLSELDLNENQFQAAETIIRAARMGLTIVEVPITVQNRIAGVSRKGTNLSYGFNFLRTIFRSWLR